jgi:hypothetical protein
LKSFWAWRPSSAKVLIGLLEATAASEPPRTVRRSATAGTRGVEAYKKEGPKFMQHLVAKQEARVRDS